MAMPRDALARRFGEAVTRRLDQALGDLPEPLSPLGEVPSRRVRLSFAEPIADPADLARAAERLTLDLAARLAREGMGARRLVLGFHRVDGRVEQIRIGTSRPSRDPVHLAKLLIAKLDTVDPGLGIADAILAVFAVEALAPEQIESSLPLKANPHPNPPPPAGEGAQPRGQELSPSPASGGGLGWGSWPGSEPSLAPLFDRLGARLGLGTIARLEPRESHVPERASVAVPLAGAIAKPLLPRAGEKGSKSPRPVRLFAPPEPIDAVLWTVPDDPPSRFHLAAPDASRRPGRRARAGRRGMVATRWAAGPVVTASPTPFATITASRTRPAAAFGCFAPGLPGDPPPRWFIHGVFA